MSLIWFSAPTTTSWTAHRSCASPSGSSSCCATERFCCRLILIIDSSPRRPCSLASARAGLRLRLQKQADDVGGRPRVAEQIPLHLGAADRLQGVQLLL